MNKILLQDLFDLPIKKCPLQPDSYDYVAMCISEPLRLKA
jgi:hypothetical protein